MGYPCTPRSTSLYWIGDNIEIYSRGNDQALAIVPRTGDHLNTTYEVRVEGTEVKFLEGETVLYQMSIPEAEAEYEPYRFVYLHYTQTGISDIEFTGAVLSPLSVSLKSGEANNNIVTLTASDPGGSADPAGWENRGRPSYVDGPARKAGKPNADVHGDDRNSPAGTESSGFD